jgi:hypothetical protein
MIICSGVVEALTVSHHHPSISIKNACTKWTQSISRTIGWNQVNLWSQFILLDHYALGGCLQRGEYGGCRLLHLLVLYGG